MHARTMKYELCNFGDSMYELNAVIFAFINGIAQYKENIFKTTVDFKGS